jgi:hypothetical protein
MKKNLIILLIVSLVFLFMACTPPSDGYTLTITYEGDGTVAVSPEKESYIENELVVLTPAPGTDLAFTGWTGDSAGDVTDNGNGTYSINMTSNKTLVANFGEGGVTVNYRMYINDSTWTTRTTNIVWGTNDALVEYNTYGGGTQAWGPTFDENLDWNDYTIFSPNVPNDNNNTSTVTVEPGTYDWGIVIDTDGDGSFTTSDSVWTWGSNEPAFANQKEFVAGDVVDVLTIYENETSGFIFTVHINDELVFNNE